MHVLRLDMDPPVLLRIVTLNICQRRASRIFRNVGQARAIRSTTQGEASRPHAESMGNERRFRNGRGGPLTK